MHQLGIHLSPMQQRLVDAVRRAGPAGLPSDRLEQILYDDPDGGPENISDRTKAIVYWTNRRLAEIGKEVRSSASGGKYGYRGRYFFRDKGERHSRVA